MSRRASVREIPDMSRRASEREVDVHHRRRKTQEMRKKDARDAEERREMRKKDARDAEGENKNRTIARIKDRGAQETRRLTVDEVLNGVARRRKNLSTISRIKDRGVQETRRSTVDEVLSRGWKERDEERRCTHQRRWPHKSAKK